MRGFTVPELLVALLISLIVGGALLAAARPAHHIVQAQLGAGELQQRVRVAVDAIARDVMMAGAGVAGGANRGPLTTTEPAVMPYRHGAVGDDPTARIFYRPDTITVRYIATSSAPGALTSHTYYLKPDAATGASQLMQYNGAAGDFPLVDNVLSMTFDYLGDPRPPRSIAPPPLGSDPDPADEYGPGENCLFTVASGTAAPRLPTLSATPQLVPLTPAMLTDGPWCPNAAAAARFDADLLRVRRVAIQLRLQAERPSLRGVAGRLFARAGAAVAAERLVPDRDIAVDLSPPNLGALP
jgi:type II secretory pathway pseudopilin PulG